MKINKSSYSLCLHMLTLFSCLLLSVYSTQAVAETNQHKQGKLKVKISTAKAKLKNDQDSSNKLRKKYLEAEDKLNKAGRQLYNTERKVKRLKKKLSKLTIQKKKLLLQTEEQRSALAQQMVALYTIGNQSHLRLLLKQDDPSGISRSFQYYSYLNNYRIKRIKTITKKLDKIKILQTKINTDSIALKVLQKEQVKRRAVLRTAAKERDLSYKRQRTIVLTQQQKLSKLKREESQLRALIQQLNAKKKKREKARKKASEKQRKERALAKKNGSKNSNQTRMGKKSIKSKALVQVDTHFVPNKPFSSLKGELSWPVKGKILHKYGSVRNERAKWDGVIIAAPAGRKVRVVARGEVEYSGRVSSLGYVVIVSHDKNYMSIYGYNSIAYKKAGDVVKANEVIAAVGNSGSIERSGLYFAIRKGTYNQNPARWIR